MKMISIKNFILVYIALRSTLAVFYGINIVGGLNILELVGFFFPMVLLSYWVMTNFWKGSSKLEKFYLLLVMWVLFSTMMKTLNYGFEGIQLFSRFFRVLNGFAVFIVFPLIFKDPKSINTLMTAFFIATLFPLSQGLAQLLFGADFGGMRTSISAANESSVYEMYYGLYHKYEGYSMAAMFGGLIMVYKMGIASKICKKKFIFYGLFVVLYLILASMTLSRTLVINMTVVCITMFVAITSKEALTYKTIVIVILLLLAFIATKNRYVESRYEHIIQRSEKEFEVVSGEADIGAAFHGRFGSWEYKLEQFKEEPLIDRLIGSKINIGPHGDYVMWLLQYGYIGVVFYCTLFFCLLWTSIRIFSKIYIMYDSYLQSYGLMVIAGLTVWLLGAIIYNSSDYPDYAYFIIGNAAIFISVGKRCNEYRGKQEDYNLYGSNASAIYGAKYCDSDNS